jgi:N-acetyl-alpha-D-muramate 1-phosphate uridylyltransferase
MITPYPVVILAGGLATRLRPVTETIPKSMILINNEPFIAHQLRLLKKNKIERVIISTGYLCEAIMNYVDLGQRFALDVSYTHDGPTLLGTAGAIKKAFSQLDDNFFVLYGDSYLLCSFLDVQQYYIQQRALALMTVFKNQGQWDHSNVEFKNGQLYHYDKVHRTEAMHYIDYGLGIFNKSAFSNIPDHTPYDLAVLYQDLLKQHKLHAYEVTKRFYEIGSFSGIKECESYLASKEEQTWNLFSNS